jgi:hypothetical protein
MAMNFGDWIGEKKLIFLAGFQGIELRLPCDFALDAM